MKQNKKIVICGVFLIVILLGLYYLYRDDSGKAACNTVWLCEEGSAGIQTIAIQNSQDQERLSFNNSEEGWIGDDESSYKKDRFASYIAVLGYMKAESKIEATDQEKLDYGLENPTYRVSVVYDGGKEYNYNLGKFIDELGMYISVDDQDNVYLIDAQRGEVLLNMVRSLYDVLLSNVNFNDIRGIHLVSPETGLISINRSEAPRANGDFYWNIFKPFETIADNREINRLIDTMKEIGAMKRTKGAMSQEECGLTDDESRQTRITFYDTYDSELSIYIGNEYGDDVYCRTNYLDGIYLISKEILKLVNLEVSDLLDSSLYYYEIPSVKACKIQWLDESYELRAQWVEANADTERGQRYFLNETDITGAEYNNIVKWFQETKVGQAGTAANNQGAVLGKITVERLSPPYVQTLTFRSLPEDSYVQVDWGGLTTAHLCREEIEHLLTVLRQ